MPADHYFHPFARSEADVSTAPPQIRARFFYFSNLALDDPLAPVPPPSASSAAASRLPPQPFSAYDNSALDQAWVTLQTQLAQYNKQLEQDAKTLGINKVREWKARDYPTSSRPSSRSAWDHTARHGAQGRARTDSQSSAATETASPSRGGSQRVRKSQSTNLRDESSDGLAEGTSGTPFIRAPVRERQAVDRSVPRSATSEPPKEQRLEEDACETKPPEDITAIVGAARIHQVTMPKLEMEPCYWTPVNDIAPVMRATWFYKDNLMPVEVDVANMLEAGYVTVRAWTQTWKDELDSAVEVGAIGEEKIVHPLWPDLPKAAGESRPTTPAGSWMFDADEEAKEKKEQDQVSVAKAAIDQSIQGTGIDNKAAGINAYGRDGAKRTYRQGSVIYADHKTAYILKPNLKPSDYYGRRPLANYIRKGHPIGVCVVRGFDEKSWETLHPRKTTQILHIPASVQQRPSPTRNLSSSAMLGLQPRITDLCLVIHGIGQKLSERMESYHFTHAMNAFRREINMELASTGIRTNLRKDAGGIMVLPVNWRSTLSFDEGGYPDGTAPRPTENNFSLADITPDSLPSVRNIVSDVMLDIPYYMSHHQPKMIGGVIKEANRIYRLWCKNNPGFERYGRVHLLAHSLGSVMSLDVLSNQPDHVHFEPEKPLCGTHFEFDTTNLYLLGSPAGFFLLLRKANLLPRKDRKKPASGGEESTPGVFGEQGHFGCIAVDNIYNIINPYDPVAYRVNAAVDAHWSEILQKAQIPSVKQPWFSFGASSNSTYGSSVTGSSAHRPPLGHLPSQMELETHNFTREEIAEKRAYMLNDNGQVDFFLRYGGGPLEIQYLTMLGAHSSYWLSKDFIRFLVMEIGRRPGRDGALQALRPVKKREYRHAT